MARRLSPNQHETLAQFLDRAIDERGSSVNEVARVLSGKTEGREFTNWERKLRRWGSGIQFAVDEAGAIEVGEVLNADFVPFIRGRHSQVDLLTEALERIDDLDSRLQALEQ